MVRLFRKRFICKATQKGFVTDGVCIHVMKTLWSELLWDIHWIKTYKIEAMYEYVVNGKLYFKYIKFRLLKECEESRNPYKIKVYYDSKNPKKSFWEADV